MALPYTTIQWADNPIVWKNNITRLNAQNMNLISNALTDISDILLGDNNDGLINQSCQVYERVIEINKELSLIDVTLKDVKLDLNTVKSDLNHKVDKVEGKGLSTNDYTTADKNTVGKIEDSQHRVPRGSTVQSQIDEINDSAFSTSNPNSLTNKFGSSISQLDSKTTLLQSQIDTKVDKVEGKGLSTNDYNDSAKDKVSKIGRTNLIPSDSQNIVQWIQDVYDSVFKSSADNTCLADEVAAEISSRQSADKNLQSQIDALGDADLSELEIDIETLKTNVSNLQSADATAMDKIGKLITDLDAVEASIGTWSSGQTISRTISELQKSTLDLDRKATSTQNDLDAVKARIGSWGTSKTLYNMIVDLTARIEAIENSAS